MNLTVPEPASKASPGVDRIGDFRRGPEGSASPPSHSWRVASDRDSIISCLLTPRTLLAHLVGGHKNQRCKRNRKQSDRWQSMQLVQAVRVEVPIEQRKTDKHEEDVRAEDPQRSFAQESRNGSIATTRRTYFRSQ